MQTTKVVSGAEVKYTATLDTVDSNHKFRQDIAEALCFTSLFKGSLCAQNRVEVPLGYLLSDEIAYERTQELQSSLTQLIDLFERHLLIHEAIEHINSHAVKQPA